MRPGRIWFDTPGVQWRLVLGVVAVATVLVALLISWQRELWSAQEVVVAVAPRLAASATPASAPRRVAYVAPAASALPAPARPVAPARAEVCAARAAPDEDITPEDVSETALQRRSRDSGARWLAAMQASGDERTRAAGWLLAQGGDAAAQRDRLATLATSSRDAQVQAYALRACRGAGPASSACQSLTPQAWVQIEADNGAAWLALSGDTRLEPAVQLDALRQAARARRFETHGAALQGLVQAAAPAGTGELDRLAMARLVAALRGDWLVTEPLRLHCSASALADPERSGLCDAIADMLATQGQSVPDLLQARDIGQRVGWPEDRLEALRDEADALLAFERRRADASELANCGELVRLNAFYAEVGRLGQLAALRQAMQRSAR
ncbi:MAG: hypothetical protein KIT35_20465 [Piscinibacter sp.]|uniref:hypothetical protein n=1 Tax=Piscinibacter sp. TaxID=1903157 RepID=UPI0025828D74|nr:hypothetical protein [Piscinibacter sp.]MCW5666212.1 hypothetical protein [Piscinibacter sp.]